MKKKLIASLLSCVMISTLLTGCTNPISGLTDKFSKDDTESVDVAVDDTEQTSGGEYNSYVYIVGEGTYAVGDTVTVEDVVEVDEIISGSLLQSYFLDESYIASQSLDTSTAGEYIVTVVGEFADGGTYQIEYPYIVEEDTGMSEIQSLVDNASYHEVVDTTNALGTKITVLYDIRVNEYNYHTIMWGDDLVYDTTVSTIMNEISISYAHEEYSLHELEGMDASELDNAIYTVACKYLSEPVMDPANAITLRSVNDVTLYAYPMTIGVCNNTYIIGYIVTPLTTPMDDTKCVFVMSAMGYVLADEIYDYFYSDISPEFADILEDISDDWYDEEDLTVYIESLAEEFLSYMEFPADDPVDVYNIVIGGEVFKSSTNEVSADGSDESASADNDIEEPEITSVASTYQSKYPELYEWPENDTKYRKWIYTIDDQVTYTGSIINPDGTIVSITNGDTISSNLAEAVSSSTPTDASTGSSPTLVSSYGSYVLKNTNSIFDFDTVSSTSSCLYLSVDGVKYYVETARASKVTSYTSSCLYSTTGMAEGDYEITAGTTVTLDNYSYTPYTITYTSTEDSKSVTTDYIFVVNFGSDYLVIYGDNLSDIHYADMAEIAEDLMKV